MGAKSIEVNSQSRVLSELLAELVKNNYSFVNTTPDKWVSDIDKINRIDGYNFETIEYIIRWSQQDDFWKQNIRSGNTLRRQFVTLMIRAKSEYDKQNSNKIISI